MARISYLGAVAAARLRSAVAANHPATVVAKLNRCVYLKLPGGLVCFGQDSIGEGPSCVLIANECWPQISNQLALQGKVVCLPYAIKFASQSLLLPLHPSQTDRVSGTMLNVPPALVSRRLHSLVSFAPEDALILLQHRVADEHTRLHRDGAVENVRTAYARYMKSRVRKLRHALDSLLHDVKHTAQNEILGAALLDCLGTGPGFTPAGDDYVAGVIIALRLYGFEQTAAQLRDCIKYQGLSRTHEISTALLIDVIDGHLSKALFDVITELTGRHHPDYGRVSAQLDAIGSTSGWDTMAGFSLVSNTIAELKVPYQFTETL